MSNKIKLGRGTKARIETVKSTLDSYEIVYATDTDEIGIKKPDGEVNYIGTSGGGGGGATIEKIDANVYLSKPDLHITDIVNVVNTIKNVYDFWQVRGVGTDTKGNEINYYVDNNGLLNNIITVNSDIENYGSFINVYENFDDQSFSIDYAVTTFDLTDFGLQIGTFDIKTQKNSFAIVGFLVFLLEMQDMIEFIITEAVMNSNLNGYVSNSATSALTYEDGGINSAIEINNVMVSLSKVNYFTDGLEDYLTNEMILYDFRFNDALFDAAKVMPGLPTYTLNLHSRIYFDTTDNEVKNMLKWELEEFTKP